MAEIEIRAERADGEAGGRLLAEFVATIERLYPGWDASQPPTSTPDDLAPPGGIFLVLYLDGEAVACGGLKRLDPEAGEIKRLYVAPAARGRGLSRRLLDALEGAAAELGYRIVRLDTGEKQPEARALFRSSGYQEIRDYNGNAYAAYWFEKQLD
jgi:GNAT superfamily N-acetyltransferase